MVAAWLLNGALLGGLGRRTNLCGRALRLAVSGLVRVGRHHEDLKRSRSKDFLGLIVEWEIPDTKWGTQKSYIWGEGVSPPTASSVTFEVKAFRRQRHRQFFERGLRNGKSRTRSEALCRTQKKKKNWRCRRRRKLLHSNMFWVPHFVSGKWILLCCATDEAEPHRGRPTVYHSGNFSIAIFFFFILFVISWNLWKSIANFPGSKCRSTTVRRSQLLYFL